MNKLFLQLIELPICKSAKGTMEFMGHWLPYRTTPNVHLTTLFTESKQAIEFAFILFAVNLTWSLLIF